MNRHLKKKIFQEQDLILVCRSKLGKPHGKLRLRYIGPYKIQKDLGQGTFQLMDMEGKSIFKLINGFRLKKNFVPGKVPQVNLCTATNVKSQSRHDVGQILERRLHVGLIIREPLVFKFLACVRGRVTFSH